MDYRKLNRNQSFTWLLAVILAASLLALSAARANYSRLPYLELRFSSYSCDVSGYVCDMTFVVKNSGTGDRSFDYVITATDDPSVDGGHVLRNETMTLQNFDEKAVSVRVDLSGYRQEPVLHFGSGYEVHFYNSWGNITLKVGVGLETR